MYRVLIADDEPIVLETLSSIIPWNELNCELIGTAKNGMDSYNKICDDYPDIVITDIRMPVLDGLELIEKAKKLDKNIDIIVLSGYDDFSYAQKAMQYGVKYYHLKPARKEDIIQSVNAIIQERTQLEQKKDYEQKQLINTLFLPLQKSFLYDALHQENLTDQMIQQYTQLLGFPENVSSFCLCTFLEEQHLKQFQEHFYQYINRHKISIYWPAYYVTNSFLFPYQTSNISEEEQLKDFIESCCFSGQKVKLECHFHYFENSTQLYREIFRKIARYHSIQLINGISAPETMNNVGLMGQNYGLLAEDLRQLSSDKQAEALINELFSSVSNLEAAILLGIRLIFSCHSLSDKSEANSYVLKCLLSSKSIEEARNITTSLFIQQFSIKDLSPKGSLIPRVKAYVESHLDSETLSLKWLAENQFYISVGYLSKQFLAEEGEHFSFYLNRQRISLAKQLMSVYHNDNIQDIAQKVGFRNNPRYFSQVFKKFTGQTPSEYLASLKE